MAQTDPLTQDFVVVASWGRHVYYFNIDHYPTPDEYLAIGTRISQKMASTIGQMPQHWAVVRASEFDPDRAASEAERDPVLVV